MNNHAGKFFAQRSNSDFAVKFPDKGPAVLSIETNSPAHDEHGIFVERIEVFQDFEEAPRENMSGSDLNGKFYLREYRDRNWDSEYVTISIIAHFTKGFYVVLEIDINPADIPAPAKLREFYYEDRPRKLRFGEGKGSPESGPE